MLAHAKRCLHFSIFMLTTPTRPTNSRWKQGPYLSKIHGTPLTAIGSAWSVIPAATIGKSQLAKTDDNKLLASGKLGGKIMARKKKSRLGPMLERFSRKVTEATGTSTAFIIALLVIVVWIVTGPLFHFSDTWQLVINTGTTIVTFLMVFLIQRSQNKDALAIHIKLNEIVAVMEGASNRIIDAESLSEDELRILEKYYSELSKLAEKEGKLTVSH